jgi:hypothetical protein
MPSFNAECPHCAAENVGFLIVAEQERPSLAETNSGRFIFWDAMATCTTCEWAVIAIYSHIAPGARKKNTPQACPSDPENFGFKLMEVLPHPRPSQAPDHLPEPLPNFFLQAENALKRGYWDASGAMSRKTLDVATKLLMKDAEKQVGNLGPRIDTLAARGKLTEDLRQWAHHVRLEGNDAAHDEDPFTKDEAEELLDFTELFLTYVFSLPGRMKDKMKSPVQAAP